MTHNRLEVIYYVAVSADGFIAPPDGSVDWLAEFEGDGDYGYEEFYAGVDTLLLGRATFEQLMALGVWPYSRKPAWVFSRRAPRAVPPGVIVVADSPEAIASRLVTAGLQRAWLVGGGELAGSFARAGLISRYILTVMPVMLGAGVPLLGPEGAAGPLSLVSSARLGRVVQNTYATRP